MGRLVLYACGEGERRAFPSLGRDMHRTATGQFWQDVREDYTRGRVYIPQDDMKRFGVTDDTIAAGSATPQFRALLRHEVDYARSLF